MSSITPTKDLDVQIDSSIAAVSRQKKKLPMIVDISIDNSGKQVYQIHETSKMIRKEMPKSNFINSKDGAQDDKTPVRNVLGTLSPSTLNQKRKRSLSIGSDDEFDEEFDSNDQSNEDNYQNNDEDNDDQNEGSPRSGIKDEGEVWGIDVEDAFEDALKIIPKNGLTKIKISGRSCGRNELISDFILQKTGKLRTRKQVSSHIQVHKNMGKNLQLIDLINNGPKNNDCIKKFDEIFSEITFQKSIGESIIPNSNSYSSLNSNSNSSSSLSLKKKRAIALPPSKIKISIEEFEMKFNKTNKESFSFTNFNKHQQNKQSNILKINDNSNIDIRFPGLLEFNDISNLPIIHNLCKLKLPKHSSYKLVNGEMNSNLKIKLADNDESNNQDYSVFTVIYSFGTEVLKLNESLNVEFGENPREKLLSYQFLNKFWLFFLQNLIENSDENAKNIAFKNITIKQIIYKNSDSQQVQQTNDPIILKKNIRSILLWEFVKLEDNDTNNYTVSSYLKLPNSQDLLNQSIKCDDNIESQSIEYVVPTKKSTLTQISSASNDLVSSSSTTFSNYPLTSSTTTINSEYGLPLTANSLVGPGPGPKFYIGDNFSQFQPMFSPIHQQSQQCFADPGLPFGGYLNQYTQPMMGNLHGNNMIEHNMNQDQYIDESDFNHGFNGESMLMNSNFIM